MTPTEYSTETLSYATSGWAGLTAKSEWKRLEPIVCENSVHLDWALLGFT